ncbi:DoxX family protein [Lentzea sp. CC55]|uniref:DoxX family protein n=1 Tax=Lentzea sp. CC55 TaxID=2884909 RepID=UPI001F45B1AA|nr:DoxX family protein [Lentzea sp. CC55]MCG8925294.1 DoxX family protein [Lentzea sp. CC55]
MSEQTSTAAKAGNVVVWILQIALAVQFFLNGYALFTDQFVAKFDDIGFGQWFRYLTGVLEIATAVGLLIPRICGLAALALAGIMAGAALTEMLLVTNGGIDDATMPLVFMVWALVIAVYRREQILGALSLVKRK